MKKVIFTSLTLCCLLATACCVSTIQRAFDPALNAQQNQLEIEAMFPAIQGFYAWLNNDFPTATVEATRKLPSNVQFGYKPGGLTTNVPANCAYVRFELDYWGFFNKRKEYLSSFKVQDDVVLAFFRSHGYTVKKYKFDFTKKIVNYFGLENLTRITPANESYGYSYAVYSSDGHVAMIYTPIIYGQYSRHFKDINTYYWDALFISTRESEKFLSSLSNSFMDDMEAK